MKQRLLVMNGQRLLQSEREGQWATSKVDKAGVIKPGIYNIFLAMSADKAKRYDGAVLHADDEYVYQQNGKACVKHAAKDFAKLPEVGCQASITYEAGQALMTASSVKLRRTLSR